MTALAKFASRLSHVGFVVDSSTEKVFLFLSFVFQVLRFLSGLSKSRYR